MLKKRAVAPVGNEKVASHGQDLSTSGKLVYIGLFQSPFMPAFAPKADAKLRRNPVAANLPTPGQPAYSSFAAPTRYLLNHAIV